MGWFMNGGSWRDVIRRGLLIFELRWAGLGPVQSRREHTRPIHSRQTPGSVAGFVAGSILVTAFCWLPQSFADHGAEVVALPNEQQGVERTLSPEWEIVSHRKIWDQAPHNAFTDLVRYRDRWYCAFREGSRHVSPDGALRVLQSVDGKAWHSSALITSKDSDLRDAKLCVTPDDRLMISGAEAFHDPLEGRHQSLAWFSENGIDWTAPTEIGDRDVWLWGVHWHQQTAYSIGYSTVDRRFVRLYRSTDGQRFEPVRPILREGPYYNESAIRFVGQTAYCLLRRDDPPATAAWGRSQFPFREWTWVDMGVRIGGPSLIVVPGESEDKATWLATVRLYEPAPRTVVCEIEPNTGRMTEMLTLPSGGDTSYAGMVWHDNQLWISYYSSHENKSSIYLAILERNAQP